MTTLTKEELEQLLPVANDILSGKIKSMIDEISNSSNENHYDFKAEGKKVIIVDKKLNAEYKVSDIIVNGYKLENKKHCIAELEEMLPAVTDKESKDEIRADLKKLYESKDTFLFSSYEEPGFIDSSDTVLFNNLCKKLCCA